MWLEVVDGAGAGDRAEVRDAPVVLGRVRGCDLVVRDARASRRHAEVVRGPGATVVVRDLGSANGTWIGEAPLEGEATLGPGDEVRIGATRLVVRERAPAPPVAAPTPSVIGALLERSSRRAGRAVAVAAVALGVAVTAVGAFAMSRGGDADDAERVVRVVAALRPAVLRVEARRDGLRTGTGSAWVLDADRGLVVTNAHVVNAGTTFSAVPAAGGAARPARVAGVAPCDDLALLRVAPGGLRAVPLGRPGALRAGQAVVALGFPARELTSTTGVVSVARTALTDPAPDVPVLRDAVLTDTAIGPGSSGGPLVDLDGRLVGVTTAARTATAGGRAVQGQNYAVGVARVWATLAALRGGTGATGLTFGYPAEADLARRRLPAGLWITGALPGTAAARHDLRGRLLVGVDDRPVATTLRSFCDAIAGARGTVALATVAPDGGAPQVVRLPLR